MATKFKITMSNGDEMLVSTKPKHVLRMEREGKSEATVESTYTLAYYASGSTLPFDEWIDEVDDIDFILEGESDEDDDIPPTTAGSRRSRSTQG